MDYNKDFKKLKYSETLEIQHPILDLKIVVSRKQSLDKVLNIPVTFYSEDIASINYISNNEDLKFQLIITDSEIEYTNLNYYIELLLKQPTVNCLKYINSLINKRLKVGDRIKFENGTIGEIVYPDDPLFTNLKFKIIKKNGELGKQERLLYANVKFEKVMK